MKKMIHASLSKLNPELNKFLNHITNNMDRIPVRRFNKDKRKWENVMLSELPVPEFIKTIERWIDERFYPLEKD